MFQVLKELQNLIPPLSEEERTQLEANCREEGIRDPLVIAVYPDPETGEELRVLADGHNRYAIAQEYGLGYTTHERGFDSLEDVKLWMIDNQKGRRNLSEWAAYKLSLSYKEILLFIGRQKLRSGKKSSKKHNTRLILSEYLGWSMTKVAQADRVLNYIESTGDTRISSLLQHGEISINQVYQKVKSKKHKSKSVKSQQSGYVYLIRSEHGFKIGKTTSIQDRMSAFSVKLPFDFQLVMSVFTKNMDLVESFLHYALNHKNSNGEWFDLSKPELQYVFNTLSLVDNRLQSWHTTNSTTNNLCTNTAPNSTPNTGRTCACTSEISEHR